MEKLLKNCTVIDGLGSALLDNAYVLLSGDRIARIESGSFDALAANTEVVDLEGAFVLPGFCSTHVHLGDLWPYPEPRDETAAERTS